MRIVAVAGAFASRRSSSSCGRPRLSAVVPIASLPPKKAAQSAAPAAAEGHTDDAENGHGNHAARLTSTNSPPRSRSHAAAAAGRAPAAAGAGDVNDLMSATLAKLSSLAMNNASLARGESFTLQLEHQINDQISLEYTFSYQYHAMASYFNRDNVALPGLAAYFDAASLEERSHASSLMELIALRGGHVQLQTIKQPEHEFAHEVMSRNTHDAFLPVLVASTRVGAVVDHTSATRPQEKGDALHAMEVALAYEALNFHKLKLLHDQVRSTAHHPACKKENKSVPLNNCAV